MTPQSDGETRWRATPRFGYNVPAKNAEATQRLYFRLACMAVIVESEFSTWLSAWGPRRHHGMLSKFHP